MLGNFLLFGINERFDRKACSGVADRDIYDRGSGITIPIHHSQTTQNLAGLASAFSSRLDTMLWLTRPSRAMRAYLISGLLVSVTQAHPMFHEA